MNWKACSTVILGGYAPPVFVGPTRIVTSTSTEMLWGSTAGYSVPYQPLYLRCAYCATQQQRPTVGKCVACGAPLEIPDPFARRR